MRATPAIRPASSPEDPLPRSFFDRPVLTVAADLLGRTLVHDSAAGPIELRLTEVEAYDGANDPGSHAYRGKTARNATMFGPPGHLYVYFTYGMYWCANLVCGPPGTASGVLLRAGEITAGMPLARVRRTTSRKDTDLASGPARLATALGFDRAHDGFDVCRHEDGTELGPIRVLYGTPPARTTIRTGPRTGVGGGGATQPWRFHIAGDPTVSPYRAHQPRKRTPKQGAPKTPTKATKT
ncbi:DNA-3-methyladenine glycosylase [Streptomyces sp. SID3343]|uniref:DNA-3-methyladenine glycosylase n=1 Tax=Streptomyces sp. SID3343 TaxID=2690260 RepID=UPI00136EFE77|nr:DNA-3-methyladenine glycosylase [Streptomyces sp. SID3343]MYW05352.1 DNA-3-methyladenine glycosylase [Streptomyces sp. SID3343]